MTPVYGRDWDQHKKNIISSPVSHRLFVTKMISKYRNRILLAQWIVSNVIRLSAITCVFLLTYQYPFPEDRDKHWITFDGGYFTAGPVIDGTNLIICFSCFAISENCHCAYWKKLIPFCCYALCDFCLSVFLADRVFRHSTFILPYFGQVDKFVCICAVLYSLLCKCYHLVLTCIIMAKDKILPPSPSPSPSPSLPPPFLDTL